MKDQEINEILEDLESRDNKVFNTLMACIQRRYEDFKERLPSYDSWLYNRYWVGQYEHKVDFDTFLIQHGKDSDLGMRYEEEMRKYKLRFFFITLNLGEDSP